MQLSLIEFCTSSVTRPFTHICWSFLRKFRARWFFTTFSPVVSCLGWSRFHVHGAKRFTRATATQRSERKKPILPIQLKCIRLIGIFINMLEALLCIRDILGNWHSIGTVTWEECHVRRFRYYERRLFTSTS